MVNAERALYLSAEGSASQTRFGQMIKSASVNDTPVFKRVKSLATEDSEELISPPHILQKKL